MRNLLVIIILVVSVNVYARSIGNESIGGGTLTTSDSSPAEVIKDNDE